MQTDMGGYQPWQAGTSGSLKAYEPTWRDKLARVLMGEQRASPERARLVEGLTGSRGMGSPGIGVVDAVPGVGQALQAQEAVRSGDTDMLAMALMPGSKQVKAATGAADDAARAGIRAYHGSPHDFDRFDMSKIGTGEGAQAYGHGLYFAEAEDVAKSYRDYVRNWQDRSIQAFDAVRRHGSPDKAIAAIQKLVDTESKMLPPGREPYGSLKNNMEVLEKLKTGDYPAKDPGRLYEVRINANPDDFLDWDKPLSQQPKVAELVGRDDQGRLMLPNGERAAPDKLRGESFYRAFAESRGGGTQPGSTALRDAGIPGIKYLDQGSRSAGEGSRNYVVFRDDIIDIVKKYGIAAAASMYGMDQVQRVLIADQLQPAAQ